jgi:diadenosine tetraphosphate (Ap4A) HIT family hydrolase
MTSGDSPFLAIPASQWVTSNELAFAIRDGYPVSPGHTLVVPKRLIADWDAATTAERDAILAVVDVVKQQLRDEFHPDGFNLGINEGAAAGQTVFHLHVHVIPRYAGDVPDPRGGIRHAVMGKGNWPQGGGSG